MIVNIHRHCYNTRMKDERTHLERVLDAISSVRAPTAPDEYDLHARIAEALARAGLPCAHEAPIAQRCRVDFLSGGVGIEVKRGKPQKKPLVKQLTRYLASDMLTAIVLVAERGLPLPDGILGKPVRVVSLQRLWGVAASARDTVSTQIPQTSRAPAPPPIPDEPTGELPGYLREQVAAGHYFGTLSYNKRRKSWTVRGEPCVTELCKRLFPGSDGGRRGEARFTAHRRVVGELNWLMLRYPLKIAESDAARWQEALSQARAYALARERALSLPQSMEPPEGAFIGTLRPFQKAGLAFLCGCERALLADEMGLGKTVEALACLATLSLFPALVVAPPHLVRNWQAEIERFLRIEGKPPRVHVIKGLKPAPLPEADVYILHYLLLRGWKEVLPALPFRCVIFDEAQELRHSGTEKYSAASLLSESCERVMGLSGTPIYNQGGEIWNVVNILDFHFLGDWESFSREWCYGYGNAVVLKPELLGEHLRREGLMLRRTKREVLPELPEKRRLVSEIDADDAVYKKLMRPVLEDLHLWREGDLTPSQRALLEDKISQQERQATGLAKAPFVCQFVRALLEAGERVLLFAHHHAVMDIYQSELAAFHPVFITGRESGAQKERAVERFMDGGTNVCCISLRAASGLNLQRASCVVFGELDWSPAVHSQAEDRAHRIGQQDSLLCYYLVSPRGSDADIQEALGLKVSQFLALMGDKPDEQAQTQALANYARRHVEMLVSRMDDV